METLQGIVTGMVSNSVQHYRNRLEGEQAAVTDLFNGVRRDYGDWGDLRAVEGRSGSVSTDIRDAVLHVLPKLLEVILGPMKIVRFVPTSPMDTQNADMQTDMVRHVLTQDNKGFIELYSAIFDGLLRDMGWVRYSWSENEQDKWMEYTGLAEMQAVAAITQPGVLSYQVLRGPYESPHTGEQVYDCAVRMGMPGRIIVESVPNDELVFSRNARSVKDADCVAHVRDVPADEVVALGYPAELVHQYSGYGDTTQTNSQLRHARDETAITSPNKVDESRMTVQFADVWAKVDVDGDGRAELRHFHCIGPQYHILNDAGTLVPRTPVVQFRPIIQPHTMYGIGYGRLLHDVQMQKSLLERSLMNTIARAIDPRPIIKEDAVEFGDVVATGLNHPIRVHGHHSVADAVGEVKSQYVGQEVIQAIDYVNNKRADRSGMARAAEGKDAAALQSSTQEAVAETFARSDVMQVFVTRMFAETGLKELYEGIAEMLMSRQDYVRRVQLDDGRFIDVDPRTWMRDREVRVNVRGWDSNKEIQFLSMILAVQEKLMERNSPLINEVHVGNTIRSLFRATGRTNVADYLSPWGPEEQQQYNQMIQQMQAMQPPPAEQQIIDNEKAKFLLEDDRDRLKMILEAALKELELEQKHKTDITAEQIKATAQAYMGQLSADAQVKAAKEMPKGAAKTS